MATNPFSKKTHKQSSVSKSPLAATLSNDKSTLNERAARRQQIDFENISLEIENQTSTGYFQASFISLVDKYQHHEFLIKQLLHGAALDIGNRIVSDTTNYCCYRGIEEFVDCLNSKIQLSHKSIRCIADIDFQTTRNFVAYLLQLYPGRTINRKHYGSVRAVATSLQKKYESNPYVGEAFTWTKAPRVSDSPTESYTDEVFNQLIEACLTDIKLIMKTMADYPGQIALAKINALDSEFAVQQNGMIFGRSRAETNLICSALVSEKYPNWPFNDSIDKAISMFSQKWKQDLSLDDKVNRDLHRIISRMRIVGEVTVNSSNEKRIVDLEVGQLAYICQFFFTFQTIVPLILFVQINTGWNIESVLNLTDDIESHFGEDLIDPDQYILIYSTKMRTKDVLYCRSNKVHPYSVYNILKFVKKQIEPFKNSLHYSAGYLWQAVPSKKTWSRIERLVVPINGEHFRRTSSEFITRHGINIQNDLKQPSIESRRIRTTFETKRKEQGLALESISEIMGHDNPNTTDVHYDRDSGSTKLRNQKLRQLQIQWDNDFRNYGIRLSLSTSLTELRQAIGTPSEKSMISKAAAQLCTDEKSIVHLLSPSGQTYIAACLNSRSPSWPDAPRFVSPGEQCSYFNRCCMCEQAVLFKESLPFVARRIIDVTGLKTRLNTFEWSNNYGEEIAAWEQILVRWNPHSDVEDAKNRAPNTEYALPLTMRGMR